MLTCVDDHLFRSRGADRQANSSRSAAHKFSFLCCPIDQLLMPATSAYISALCENHRPGSTVNCTMAKKRTASAKRQLSKQWFQPANS